MCTTIMVAADSRERSRLLLLLYFRVLLFFSNSLLTQHPRKLACSWSVLVFIWERGAVLVELQLVFWGEEESPSFLPFAFISLINMRGVY